MQSFLPLAWGDPPLFCPKSKLCVYFRLNNTHLILGICEILVSQMSGVFFHHVFLPRASLTRAVIGSNKKPWKVAVRVEMKNALHVLLALKVIQTGCMSACWVGFSGILNWSNFCWVTDGGIYNRTRNLYKYSLRVLILTSYSTLAASWLVGLSMLIL